MEDINILSEIQNYKNLIWEVCTILSNMYSDECLDWELVESTKEDMCSYGLRIGNNYTERVIERYVIGDGDSAKYRSRLGVVLYALKDVPKFDIDLEYFDSKGYYDEESKYNRLYNQIKNALSVIYREVESGVIESEASNFMFSMWVAGNTMMNVIKAVNKKIAELKTFVGYGDEASDKQQEAQPNEAVAVTLPIEIDKPIVRAAIREAMQVDESGCALIEQVGDKYRWNEGNVLLACFFGLLLCGDDTYTKHNLDERIYIRGSGFFPETAVQEVFVNKSGKPFRGLGQSRLQKHNTKIPAGLERVEKVIERVKAAK